MSTAAHATTKQGETCHEKPPPIDAHAFMSLQTCPIKTKSLSQSL